MMLDVDYTKGKSPYVSEKTFCTNSAMNMAVTETDGNGTCDGTHLTVGAYLNGHGAS